MYATMEDCLNIRTLLIGLTYAQEIVASRMNRMSFLDLTHVPDHVHSAVAVNI